MESGLMVEWSDIQMLSEYWTGIQMAFPKCQPFWMSTIMYGIQMLSEY